MVKGKLPVSEPAKGHGCGCDSCSESEGFFRGTLVSTSLSGLFLRAGLVSRGLLVGGIWGTMGFGMAVIAGGWFIAPKAIRAVRRLSPDMNLLMTVAVLGAAAIGQWSEAAAVTFVFSLAELLESFSVARAR